MLRIIVFFLVSFNWQIKIEDGDSQKFILLSQTALSIEPGKYAY